PASRGVAGGVPAPLRWRRPARRHSGRAARSLPGGRSAGPAAPGREGACRHRPPARSLPRGFRAPRPRGADHGGRRGSARRGAGHGATARPPRAPDAARVPGRAHGGEAMTDVVCASGVELLAEYLEGTLAANVRADLEAHVAGCPRCTAFVASYRETPRILREASAVTMPPDLEESLLRFLRSRRGR